MEINLEEIVNHVQRPPPAEVLRYQRRTPSAPPRAAPRAEVGGRRGWGGEGGWWRGHVRRVRAARGRVCYARALFGRLDGRSISDCDAKRFLQHGRRLLQLARLLATRLELRVRPARRAAEAEVEDVERGKRPGRVLVEGGLEGGVRSLEICVRLHVVAALRRCERIQVHQQHLVVRLLKRRTAELRQVDGARSELREESGIAGVKLHRLCQRIAALRRDCLSHGLRQRLREESARRGRRCTPRVSRRRARVGVGWAQAVVGAGGVPAPRSTALCERSPGRARSAERYLRRSSRGESSDAAAPRAPPAACCGLGETREVGLSAGALPTHKHNPAHSQHGGLITRWFGWFSLKQDRSPPL